MLATLGATALAETSRAKWWRLNAPEGSHVVNVPRVPTRCRRRGEPLVGRELRKEHQLDAVRMERDVDVVQRYVLAQRLDTLHRVRH